MTIFQQDLDAWFRAPEGADEVEVQISEQTLQLATTMLSDAAVPLDDREYALRRLRETYMYICCSRRGHDVRLRYSSPTVGNA